MLQMYSIVFVGRALKGPFFLLSTNDGNRCGTISMVRCKLFKFQTKFITNMSWLKFLFDILPSCPFAARFVVISFSLNSQRLKVLCFQLQLTAFGIWQD